MQIHSTLLIPSCRRKKALLFLARQSRSEYEFFYFSSSFDTDSSQLPLCQRNISSLKVYGRKGNRNDKREEGCAEEERKIIEEEKEKEEHLCHRFNSFYSVTLNTHLRALLLGNLAHRIISRKIFSSLIDLTCSLTFYTTCLLYTINRLFSTVTLGLHAHMTLHSRSECRRSTRRAHVRHRKRRVLRPTRTSMTRWLSFDRRPYHHHFIQ
jgi:hypothetical protein